MQIVTPEFHQMAQNGLIPIDWDFMASFPKNFDDSITFFILDSSLLDGGDILSPSEDNPIQEWDYYDYTSYKGRVISLEWQRELDFPYSVQSSIADITLNNYDNFFSPHGGSIIAPYAIPKRPVRLYAGFRTVGVISQFVGLTQTSPVIDNQSKQASLNALDFLSEMFDMKLTNTIAMQNVTTDVVLDAIFQQFGLSPSQYSLAVGRNRIPFLFFERGKNAGNAFRELMQSEMGKLWLDEQGIIRFEQRLQGSETPVMTFDNGNIISISDTGDNEIINTVRIRSNIRAVQSFQPIFTNAQPEGQAVSLDSAFRIAASSSAFYPDATLEDPALTAAPPTLGRKSDNSWFTAFDDSGNPVTSGITPGLFVLNNGSVTLVLNNTNAFPVYIDQMEIWGEPAKIVDTINYEALDDVSVENYGEQPLEIENDFFGSLSNCDSFAEFVLDSYADNAGVIEMQVKGDPSLQLGDVITVDSNDYDHSYKIISTAARLEKFSLQYTIKARRYTPRNWFILDQSLLNSTDVLAP